MKQQYPKCTKLMKRGTKPQSIQFAGLSKTIDMPGWYCFTCEGGIHTGEDLQVSDLALNELEALANDASSF